MAQLKDNRFIQSFYNQPNQFSDNRTTMPMETRVVDPNAERIAAMQQNQGLIDVSDIGVGGVGVAGRAVGSAFARGMTHPASMAGRRVGREAQQVLNRNPNIVQNAVGSRVEVGVPQTMQQSAQNLAEVNQYVPKERMASFKGKDSFGMIDEAGLMDLPQGVREKAIGDFWSKNPKLKKQAMQQESDDMLSAHGFDSNKDKMYDNWNAIERESTKAGVPYPKPKNKKEARFNRLVEKEQGWGESAEDVLAMEDEEFGRRLYDAVGGGI